MQTYEIIESIASFKIQKDTLCLDCLRKTPCAKYKWNRENTPQNNWNNFDMSSVKNRIVAINKRRQEIKVSDQFIPLKSRM